VVSVSKTKILSIVKKVKAASFTLNTLTTEHKNVVLRELADALLTLTPEILRANAKDVSAAQKKGITAAMLDRLTLTDKRIKDMASAVLEVAGLKDPVGETIEHTQRNNLTISRVRIPLGVIGMVYEARPNVTVDAACLCFKSGNAVILRGGSEAFHSNSILVKIIGQVFKRLKIDPNAVAMIPFTDRKAMIDLLQMDQYIDVIIPRGGESLMQFIKKHSAIPVIKHDKGVCSIFVDESAKIDASLNIIENAKVQRPGVCNALETLYVHKNIAATFLPLLAARLQKLGVEMRGDPTVRKHIPAAKRATEKDWSTEYLDLILAVKTVADVNDAIVNIRKYSSNHTESILTESKANAALFVRSLDSSCVCINSSTRFNDGGQLGLGAEIGISTTKLHAYGPMGLRELTAVKFVVESDYRIRA
jgi:glutamate-5-semialdehyde dehydrogenase